LIAAGKPLPPPNYFYINEMRNILFQTRRSLCSINKPQLLTIRHFAVDPFNLVGILSNTGNVVVKIEMFDQPIPA
jgi:hypothetical protein